MIEDKKMMDGCSATTHIAYGLSDVATIYPISPASDMGEMADKWGLSGKKNLFNQIMIVKELESELGAAGATHGCLSGGALATTFTASQGLMLMIPNMYKMSGELLPGVFHVASRSISAHALSIFGDHQDIMACRQTGFSFLASNNVQECMDLGLVAHLSAIEGSLPICHFFDGMRTSSELQKISVIDYKYIEPLVNWDMVRKFRDRAMNPDHPNMRGSAQDPDVYFQNKEAANVYYNALPDIVKLNMKKIYSLTGRNYNLFDYYGSSNAEYVITAMGSACDAIEETIDYLNKNGYNVGLIKVRLYRPFATNHFINAIPKSAKVICALDRTKEPGSQGEPLYQDVCTAIISNGINIKVLGGRYGLSSKDFTPSMVKSVFDNMMHAIPKNNFTIGITDDLTNTSLEVNDIIYTVPEGTIQCKFFGIGSDGTVSANKQAARIIGDNTNKYVQAYFSFDSKKSGGYTVSHLRFGDLPIKSSYLINDADYIACHKDTYVNRFDVLDGIKEGGIFVLNSPWSLDEMESKLPANIKRIIANKKIKFYNIDANKIAQENNLGVRINMIMQTAFFKLTNLIEFDKVIGLLKDSIKQTYDKQGDNIIEQNYKAIDTAQESLTLINYPSNWSDAPYTTIAESSEPKFIRNIARPILSLKGDNLPVSLFTPDGFLPMGTTAYEKRRVATNIPQWNADTCIQCTQCSFVCPHAAIRPYLATKEELNNAPDTFITNQAYGGDNFYNLKYRIQVYPEDCLGCGCCVNECPVGALSFTPIDNVLQNEIINLKYAQDNIISKEGLLPRNSVKGSQLYTPLLEFSGACAGCGETPHVKLLTQLFGERMIIANATGCSSIWGASMPSMPYTVNKDNRGPAWGNSLFEDGAEYGFGINTAINHRRDKLVDLVNSALADNNTNSSIKTKLNDWLNSKDDNELSFSKGEELVSLIGNNNSSILTQIVENKDLLGKKSVWVVGGDGWAYDIGFGGLDHVLAQGENINVLVLDTECYSNTGGQTSKATPLGAVAKFSAAGKRTNRKELGRMFMVYGNIYVASIAIGANKQQAINALIEAEAYNGPSIVIAYCPCINHGIKKGMGNSIKEQANAVKSGYWPLYRYNPIGKDGNNSLIVDYAKPDGSLPSFLDGEDRYAILENTLPDIAKVLREKLADNCTKVYNEL